MIGSSMLLFNKAMNRICTKWNTNVLQAGYALPTYRCIMDSLIQQGRYIDVITEKEIQTIPLNPNIDIGNEKISQVKLPIQSYNDGKWTNLQRPKEEVKARETIMAGEGDKFDSNPTNKQETTNYNFGVSTMRT